jgi:hypothetical protein
MYMNIYVYEYICIYMYIFTYIYIYTYIGQTGRESLPALAMRPAALHVHYLGFPSTIGATYIDHIIGDPVVSPPEFVGDYT